MLEEVQMRSSVLGKACWPMLQVRSFGSPGGKKSLPGKPRRATHFLQPSALCLSSFCFLLFYKTPTYLEDTSFQTPQNTPPRHHGGLFTSA